MKEIRNLDAVITKEEILEAMAGPYEGVDAKLVSLRKSFGDSQTAVLMLPSASAKQINS